MALMLLVTSCGSDDEDVCEGEERQKLDALIQSLGNEAAACGQLVNDFGAYLSCVNRIITHAQEGKASLSPACQRTYDSMSTPPAGSPSGTMCFGGTCCTMSSCL